MNNVCKNAEDVIMDVNLDVEYKSRSSKVRYLGTS